MPDTEVQFDALPPEAQSAFSSPAPETPGLKEIDPVRDLDSAGLFELTKQKAFSPVEWAMQNPERATDPETVAKLAETHALTRERGFQPEDLPSPVEAVKAVGHTGVGVAKQLFNYSQILTMPFASLIGAISGQGPDFQAELSKQNERRKIETAAGTELAVSGLSQLPGKALRKAAHFTGLEKPYDLQTPEEKSKAFFDDLGKAQAAQEITTGHGGLISAVGGETVKELEAAGTPIRPEEVESLAAGDPLSFILFGKAFNAAGQAASKVLPSVALPSAANVAATAGGRAIQVAGKAGQLAGAGTTLAGKVAPLVGGISGATTGASFGRPISGAISGLAAGRWAGKALKEAGSTISGAGKAVATAGEQVATGVGLTPWSQAARDVLQAAPGLAADVAKGVGFDVGLAAATSESPQETEATSAFGTVLGGLHGIGRAGSRVVRGQIVAPRAWGVEAKTPAYGSFKNLDALHAQAETSAAPGQVLRANSIRQFLKGTEGNAEAFLMPSADAMSKALVERGVSPEQAKFYSEQNGMFTGDLLDDAGNKRRVVLLNNADSAPHESFHVLQDVLGETANQTIDKLVRQEYGDVWDQIGQDYASRLGAETTVAWRDSILDKSGWGSAAAAEKTLVDAANKLRNETGAEPSPEDTNALAQIILKQARDSGAGWREILTPEEAAAKADSYIARELAAENFDAAFKHTGPGLKDGNSLPEKLARIVAKTASWLGAEPLAGAKTDILGVEPKFKVVTGVKELARSQQVQVEPAPAKSTAKSPAKSIFTPEQRAAEGSKAERMAGELSARNPAQAEVLRKIASAISGGNGLKVDYRAAPGEPGGSPNMSREARRAVIEAFRSMPEEVRPLWEKLNFPDRVEATKNRGFQILGWSSENFAANAQKTARFIADVFDKGQTIDMPYEVDPATKSFTPDAWKQIYEDAQVFVANQAAGGTGSGKPLTLPADAAAMRITVPPLREGALVPLNQHAADFHNILFNLPIPETARVSRKGGVPGNIVAQRIAKGMEPVVGPRVVEPGRVRSTAEFKGFPGEKIMEVNPLRARMEQAASDAGVSFPSLIETSQRLNLEHIADVTIAPEAPVIRGVTDTLRAGFAPAAEKEWRITGQLRGSKVEKFLKAPSEIEARKLATAQGFRVETASPRPPQEGRLGQFAPGETTTFTARPVEELGKEIIAMSPDEFVAATKTFNGGLTGRAERVGLALTKKEEVAQLRKFAEDATSESRKLMKAGDFDSALTSALKTQFFNEAISAATGVGGNADQLRKTFGDSYKPPFPEGAVEAKASFAPKKKDESKLLPAGADGMSKAWILPSGKIEQLGAQWHHHWLSDNPEIAKKYNLTVPKFEGNDTEGVREGALKKGFVRVNYGKNTGTLTVESRVKDWRHQKAAVEKLIETNLDDVDNVVIHLLSEDASKMVDSDSEKLFRYDTDQEKLANIPFITKSEARSQFSPAALSGEKTFSSEKFDSELSRIREGKSDGQTFTADGAPWQPPKDPVDIVTLASVNLPLGEITREKVVAALKRYKDLLQQPGIVSGIFAFTQGKKPMASVDVNVVVPQDSRKNTLRFAKDNNQISIFDADKMETVNSGGTGDTRLSDIGQMKKAAELLTAGKPVDVEKLAEESLVRPKKPSR